MIAQTAININKWTAMEPAGYFFVNNLSTISCTSFFKVDKSVHGFCVLTVK